MAPEKNEPTRVYKNAYGDWAAQDYFKMPDGRALYVLTMKRSSGTVFTDAKVVRGDSRMHTYDPFSDYREVLGNVRMRCTENAIREHHQSLTTDEKIGAVLDRAVVHYKSQVKG